MCADVPRKEKSSATAGSAGRDYEDERAARRENLAKSSQASTQSSEKEPTSEEQQSTGIGQSARGQHGTRVEGGVTAVIPRPVRSRKKSLAERVRASEEKARRREARAAGDASAA